MIAKIISSIFLKKIFLLIQTKFLKDILTLWKSKMIPKFFENFIEGRQMFSKKDKKKENIKRETNEKVSTIFALKVNHILALIHH